MHPLKALVIALGALIAISLGLVAWGFYSKATAPGFKLTKSAETAPTAPAAGFGEQHLALPEGCSVVEMRSDGDRLFIRTGPSGLCERIMVVDVAAGKLLGTFVLRP